MALWSIKLDFFRLVNIFCVVISLCEFVEGLFCAVDLLRERKLNRIWLAQKRKGCIIINTLCFGAKRETKFYET